MSRDGAMRTFCDDLIVAATKTTGGIKWRPFAPRAAVEAELARRGYELCEDGANHDPRLRRFFAVQRPIVVLTPASGHARDLSELSPKTQQRIADGRERFLKP